MMLLVCVLALTSCLMRVACNEGIDGHTESLKNASNSAKDMYVIQATVYQVGILTNETDNATDNYNSTGSQSSVTLYSTNGKNLDLSAIPEPLLTNVTAQSVVGVAPVSDAYNNPNKAPGWGSLNGPNPAGLYLGKPNHTIIEDIQPLTKTKTKRSLDNYFLQLFKRDTTGSHTPVKVINGTAVIPSEVGLQSIGIPPLFSLNNNFSEIPVPIPNTSVIHYAKVDTLIQKP